MGDEANAAVETIATIEDAQRRAAQAHLPGVGLVDPGDNFEQGALAGAVFADQGVDLARLERERHVVEGLDAGEVLADGLEL